MRIGTPHRRRERARRPGGTGRGSHPGVFRVQEEIERLRSPMVSVRKVVDADGGHVAELDLIGDEPVDPLLQRLRSGTPMFRQVELIDDQPQAERRNRRLVRLRLKTG